MTNWVPGTSGYQRLSTLGAAGKLRGSKSFSVMARGDRVVGVAAGAVVAPEVPHAASATETSIAATVTAPARRLPMVPFLPSGRPQGAVGAGPARPVRAPAEA
jgi:hypothetical protein